MSRGVFLLMFLVTRVFADTAWIWPVSEFWRNASNWSEGVPTLNATFIYITNANSKTVTVDAGTPLANLEIDSLELSAPAGQTNGLLLESLGANPFRVIGVMAVNGGGLVQLTNSTLFIDGETAANLDVNAGQLDLLSGEINLSEFSRLRVGVGGTGNVNVVSGALHSEDEFDVGVGSPGSRGFVTIKGGNVFSGTLLSIGTDPGTFGEMIVNGGTLVATNDLFVTRIGDDGSGTLALQNGTIEFGDVSVGRNAGARGVWNISGGSADTTDLSIGRFAGAVGILNVTGGRLSCGDESFYIGREGSGEVNITAGKISGIEVFVATNSAATGTLTIAGGTLETSALYVGSILGGSGGIVNLNGGSLLVTNETATAALRVVNGALTVNGGQLEADSIFVTNVPGALRLKGGTIVSSSTRIANGQPFVIGDGTNTAMFRIDGGTHTFVDGLVISANASVVGCGQIVGAIQNNGVLSTNCAAVTAPKLTSPLRSQGQFLFSFQSETGVNYTVEYKQNLYDPAWTRLRDYAGAGGLIEVTDTTADAMRFYRVVIY